jgi:uncharacterized protein YqeY
MLIDDIKRRIASALRSGNTTEKEVLRVALGEIQTIEARGTEAAGDDLALAVVRKLIKSDEETLALATDADKKKQLTEEIEILRSLLPKGLDIEQIVALLAPVLDAIRAAGNDGQATGIAMKHLKAAGAAVTGKEVSEAVRKMRA